MASRTMRSMWMADSHSFAIITWHSIASMDAWPDYVQYVDCWHLHVILHYMHMLSYWLEEVCIIYTGNILHTIIIGAAIAISYPMDVLKTLYTLCVCVHA